MPFMCMLPSYNHVFKSLSKVIHISHNYGELKTENVEQMNKGATPRKGIMTNGGKKKSVFVKH